jgi:hypothetical protein
MPESTAGFLEFVWLPAFEESAQRILGEDEQIALERELLENPTKGSVIRGAGGVRKIRVRRPGQGKRGGVRVIYYFLSAKQRIYLIAAYAKSEREDLTPADRLVIRKHVRELVRED